MSRSRSPALVARLSIACVPCLALGCSSGDSHAQPDSLPSTRTAPDAVHVQGRTFRDGLGRQLLFRGINVKVPGLFDVTFDDGRTANEQIVPFTADDAARIEQLGLNVIRLAVNWSGLEPQPGAYGAAFLAGIDGVVELARQHHFYVLIDMHQDAYSKEIGEDGAPLWAIVPPPEQLLQGPYSDDRRTSSQVLAAGFSFFSNKPATDGRPLQDAFVQAVRVIVQRYAQEPAVLGYEAYNEPVVLDYRQLDDFHARFADGVHAVDQDAPVLFEPQATRNQTDSARIPTEPWSHGPGAYAPHIYTGWFSIPDQGGWASEDPSVLASSMAHADQEAQGWGTPLFVTEFGCDQSVDRGPRWLQAELDLQDRFLASSTQWVWREAGTWGLSDNNRVERPATARVLARTYPRAVAGDLLGIEHPEPGHLLVRWRATAATRGLQHEVSLSEVYATNYHVRCDGAEVSFEAFPGRATFTCPEGDGDRTFEVVGTAAQ